MSKHWVMLCLVCRPPLAPFARWRCILHFGHCGDADELQLKSMFDVSTLDCNKSITVGRKSMAVNMKSGMRENRNHLRFENHFRSVVYAAGLAAGTSCCCGITCATSECCSCSCQRKERKQRRCRCCGLLKYSCSYFHFDNCKLSIANCQLSITERQMFFKQQKYLSFLVVSLEVVSWRGYGCRLFRFRHWLFILYWSVQFYLFFLDFCFCFFCLLIIFCTVSRCTPRRSADCVIV